jgi:phosphatidate cytidylyltransferase
MLMAGPLFDARGAQLVAGVALSWWLLAFFSLWAYPRRLPTSIVMISAPIALLPAWFLLAYVHGSNPQGPFLVLSLIAIIWAADVGAYLFGYQFGRVKLAPTISPGKTWEGVIGGLVFATVVALLAGIALDLSLIAFVSVSLAATTVSVVGDLTISMLKRYVGLKDSGRLLPGHGGVLDRIDSISAAVPFFFVGIQMAGI